MESRERRSQFQIQPRYLEDKEWETVALQEGLFYEAIEMFSPPVLGNEHLTEDCLRWYMAGGRTLSVHGAFIDVNPASSDMAVRSLARRRCQESCHIAAKVGAKNIVFHSSCATFLRGMYLDSWAGVCAEYYEELAQKSGLRIWIENSQDIDAVPLMELMKRISSPQIGVCLDLGHAHYSRLSIEQWFDCLGDRIGYLHLSDNNGVWDEHLPLGEGNIDWEKADRCWRAADRVMPITIEVGDLEDLQRSIRFLKENGYFGMDS